MWGVIGANVTAYAKAIDNCLQGVIMSIDSDSDSGAGAICIPNISTRERRKRLASGVGALIIAVAILVVLMASGTSQWWRLVLFPLFFSAASGFFQWRDKT